MLDTDPMKIGEGSEEEELYRENILDHYKNPQNQGELENPHVHARGLNPLCGDELELFINFNEGVVSEVKFKGNGCAISMASASMLTEKIVGKTEEELKKITSEDINAMLGVKLSVVRMKCGTLSLKTLHKGLGERK